MIAYRVSRSELERLIEAHSPGWLDRARQRTAQFRRLGKYQESSSIWSEIKAVYITLQGRSKCAFCERKLESVEYGKGEQAVEHFRPKREIKAWKVPAVLKAQGIAVKKPPSKTGYHLLAYDVFNYSAACHPCNSALKRNYFPVEGAYDTSGTRSEGLISERALLIFPLGDFDAEPESLIRFHGVSPQAVAHAGYPRRRALTTIEFFQLDHPSRSNLVRERAMVITNLFQALERLRSPSNQAEEVRARKILEGLTASNSQHANCARCFYTLFNIDPADARLVADSAADIVQSKS